MPKFYLLILLSVFAPPSAFSPIENGKSNWSVLSAPSMDSAKSALTENVEIVPGRVHITLITDSPQFVRPVNGIVFGAQSTKTNDKLTFEFQHAGKKVVRRVGDGNYACESFGWYPAPFQNERGVDEFGPAHEFRPHLPQPQKTQARHYRR